jgi:hypothetical protein
MISKNTTPSYPIETIVSGGQTGVDRAALDIAIEYKIPHSGWCPFGRKAEDGVILPKYNLKEAPEPTPEESKDPDAIYKKRTELNAKDSDGTLIILKDAPMGGTLFTIDMLKKYNKPYLIYNIEKSSGINEIIGWIKKNNIKKLNVAGPRESQTDGIYKAALNILRGVLSYELKPTSNKQMKSAI